MAERKTFWVVTIAMVLIVLIVALLAFYIYQEAKSFSKKGQELYDKSNTFLRQGKDLLDRANETLDKVEPAADIVQANLPMARDFISDMKGSGPVQALARKFF